jgi:hypothetical protein
MTWYVVSERPDNKDPAAEIWTLSETPDKCGWETDGGYDGYGLTKAKAEYLAGVANDDELEHGPA